MSGGTDVVKGFKAKLLGVLAGWDTSSSPAPWRFPEPCWLTSSPLMVTAPFLQEPLGPYFAADVLIGPC